MKHVAVRRAFPWLALALLGLGVAPSCGTQQGEQQPDARPAEEEPTTPVTTTRPAAPVEGRTTEESTATMQGGRATEEV